MFSDPFERAVFLGLAALVGGLFLTLLAARPRRALFAFLFGVLIFEHYPMAFSASTVCPEFYNNLNVTTGIGALKLNPIEIILGCVAFGAALAAFRRHADSGAPIVWPRIAFAGVLYAAWMVFAAAWGVVRGGDWKVALWIVRPVVYFVLSAALFYQLCRTPKHCAQVAAIILAATVIKSMQIIVRHNFSGIEKGSVEAYGSHEDTSFALWSVWFLINGFYQRGRGRLSLVLWGLLPILLLGVLFNDRRINIATMGLGIMFMVLLQQPRALARRRREIALIVGAGVLYLIVGWFGPKNAITAPAKGFKEGIRAEIFGDNTDNSSWYRKVERFNLRQTIRANPILGTGLGRRYLQPIPLDDLGFGYAVYISHNQVLLVHSATGSIGYFIFLSFFTLLVAQLAIYARALREPWQKATAICALMSVMNWLLVGYYDMQLFFFRNSIIVGAFVALPAALFRHQVFETRAELDQEPGEHERHATPLPPRSL